MLSGHASAALFSCRKSSAGSGPASDDGPCRCCPLVQLIDFQFHGVEGQRHGSFLTGAISTALFMH